jgi:hypothetical protein
MTIPEVESRKVIKTIAFPDDIRVFVLTGFNAGFREQQQQSAGLSDRGRGQRTSAEDRSSRTCCAGGELRAL